MDFRQTKLRLAMAIIAGGMLMTLLWYAWQGWVLGRGYPYNTFLFKPSVRYSDFTEVLAFASRPGLHNNYFPAGYLLYYAFLPLPPIVGAVLFVDVCALALFFVLIYVLRHLVPSLAKRVMVSLVFVWSYPVLYCVDRGNSEILLVFLIGMTLVFFQQRKFGISFLFLLPAICFKLVPGILLFLFFRRGMLRWIFLGASAFVLINGALLLSYPGTLVQNLSNLIFQFDVYNGRYIVGQEGVAHTASAWNPFRIVVWLAYSYMHNSYVWPMPMKWVVAASNVYSILSLSLLCIVAIFTVLVETTFPRKAAMLLLYLTVSAPGGGDYKVMYVGMALILLILSRDRRMNDLWITGLLSVCLFPKREVILTFIGRSDSSYNDCSLDVIVIPLCILIAMFLLLKDGLKVHQPSISKCFLKFVLIFQLDKIRRLILFFYKKYAEARGAE